MGYIYMVYPIINPNWDGETNIYKSYILSGLPDYIYIFIYIRLYNIAKFSIFPSYAKFTGDTLEPRQVFQELERDSTGRISPQLWDDWVSGLFPPWEDDGNHSCHSFLVPSLC